MTKPEMNPPDLGCKRPSRDWYCSRQPGHEGPCAARRVSCLNVNDGIERGAPWKIVTQAEGLADFLSSPPPSETKLSEAIDRLQQAQFYFDDLASMRFSARPASEGTMERAGESLSQARSSLESLYRELLDEKRIAEASFCAFHTREYLFAGLPIHRKAIECRNEEIDDLRAELSALRSLQLTESEDWQLDQAIEDAEALPRPDVQIECLRGLLQKLRISSKATSEEL